MSGARSRRKGARFELIVAHALGGRRGFQRRSGSDEADVEGVSLPVLGPVWIECKVGQRPNLYAALAQAAEATDGRPVVVVARKNSPGGSSPSVDTVTLRLADFLRLVEGGS